MIPPLQTLAVRYGPHLGQALFRRLSTYHPDTPWRLLGSWSEKPYPDKPGFYAITTPPEDPLRLANASTGDQLTVATFRFLSDYGSIPRLVTRLASHVDLDLSPRAYPIPYLLHDALYHTHRILRYHADGTADATPVSQAQADAILATALLAEPPTGQPAPALLAALVSEAVAAFGRPSFLSGPSSDPLASPLQPRFHLPAIPHFKFSQS